jgi:hypothetical protein
MNCHFSWVPGRAWITDSEGGEHDCVVHNYVPSLSIAVKASATEAFSAAPGVPALIADGSIGAAMNIHSDVEIFTATLTALPAAELAIAPLPADEDAADVAEGPQLLEVPPPPAPDSLEVRLRREAKTTLHLMTHLPMNRYCDFCNEGKLKQKPARRRKDPEMVEKPEV